MRNVLPVRTIRGYTLLEMIVAVGIFSIVMLAATGAYLSLIRLDRHARAVNDIANNLSFAVDSMARSIRTGTNYDCDPSQNGSQSCTVPSSSFSFRDSEVPARTIIYSLSASGQLMVSINSANAVPLTDPRVDIERLDFYVRGVDTGDDIQPQVIFSIKGTMPTGANQASTTFSIEGAATQRLIDL